MFIMFAITDAFRKKSDFSSFIGLYRKKDNSIMFYEELNEQKIWQEEQDQPLFKEFSHWQHKFRI